MENKRQRKKECSRCHRKLWLRNFYKLKNGGRGSMCREHLLLANVRNKELGYLGGVTKGVKFRGNQYTGRVGIE